MPHERWEWAQEQVADVLCEFAPSVRLRILRKAIMAESQRQRMVLAHRSGKARTFGIDPTRRIDPEKRASDKPQSDPPCKRVANR